MVPFLSGGLAFLVGGIILYAAGVDPLEAYSLIIKGSLGSTRAIADTLVKTISLLIAGLAVLSHLSANYGISALKANSIWEPWEGCWLGSLWWA